MSKGILGLGCSFMFGESLYFYSDLPNLPLGQKHNYNPKNITDGMNQYKNKYRYIQQVSDHFNTWCSVKNVNGMNNTRNIEILKKLYNKNYIYEDKFDFKLHINDYKLIVFQFTSIYRDDRNIDDLLKELDIYLTHFEDNNIKVVTLSWMNEIFESKVYQEKYLNRHVNIRINNIEQPSFEGFIHDDSLNITIRSDFKEQNLQVNDTHLNHYGSRLFAESIIRKLEQDNFTI